MNSWRTTKRTSKRSTNNEAQKEQIREKIGRIQPHHGVDQNDHSCWCFDIADNNFGEDHMSHPVNDELMERYYEEGLELGLSEEEAEKYAEQKFWQEAY